MQGNCAVGVRSRLTAAVPAEQFDDFRLTTPDRLVQRGVSVLISDVHIGTVR